MVFLNNHLLLGQTFSHIPILNYDFKQKTLCYDHLDLRFITKLA